jgi:hypothetical protein
VLKASQLTDAVPSTVPLRTMQSARQFAQVADRAVEFLGCGRGPAIGAGPQARPARLGVLVLSQHVETRHAVDLPGRTAADAGS